MSEFNVTDLTDKAPAEICSVCAKNGIEHGPTQTLLVHCSHNITGAYKASGRDWKVIRGIEPGYFRETVLRGLTWGELRVELQRDLKALVQDEADHSTKH